MNKEDKMLRLLLSDKRLSSFYEFNADYYQSIDEALRSDNPIIVAIAKIIRNISSNDISEYRDFYKEIYQYLTLSL
ncbi:MAG: hypothetical protein PHN41_04310 [Bacteroidales bacterium]|nr:hypothetical protein [Bacteroidales bacterium]